MFGSRLSLGGPSRQAASSSVHPEELKNMSLADLMDREFPQDRLNLRKNTFSEDLHYSRFQHRQSFDGPSLNRREHSSPFRQNERTLSNYADRMFGRHDQHRYGRQVDADQDRLGRHGIDDLDRYGKLSRVDPGQYSQHSKEYPDRYSRHMEGDHERYNWNGKDLRYDRHGNEGTERYGRLDNEHQYGYGKQGQVMNNERGNSSAPEQDFNISAYVQKLYADEFIRKSTSAGHSSTDNVMSARNLLNNVIQKDVRKSEVPDFIKSYVAKSYGRGSDSQIGNRLKNEVTLRSSRVEVEDKSPSPLEDGQRNKDMVGYVQQLQERIEKDRLKILQYQTLLQVENRTESQSRNDVKNRPELENRTASQSRKEEKNRTEFQASKVGNISEKATYAQSGQSPKKHLWEVSGSSVDDEVTFVGEKRFHMSSREGVPPESSSLKQRPSLKSRSRSPRESRRKSPMIFRSRSPRRSQSPQLRSRSPRRSFRSPKRIRSRSPKRIRHRSPENIRNRSPKRFRSRSPDLVAHNSRLHGHLSNRPPRLEDDAKRRSNSLDSKLFIGALTLILEAIRKTKTSYCLEVLKDGNSVDFFECPSELRVRLLLSGFQLKFDASPSARGCHWDMLTDVLEFAKACDLKHEVYVEAIAHDDSIDIHDTKPYELAEYFKGVDVMFDFKTLDKDVLKDLRENPVGRHGPHRLPVRRTEYQLSPQRNIKDRLQSSQTLESQQDYRMSAKLRLRPPTNTELDPGSSENSKFRLREEQSKSDPPKQSVFSRLGALPLL